MDKPELVIFSSSRLIAIAQAMREHLKDAFTVTPWTEGFFRSNEVLLNTFLKKLLCFDAAVVVLGADDMRQTNQEGASAVWVPRDNVIFELGACMSRLGTQKTFIICPETPPVVLPSYFKGIYPLTYERRADNNMVAAVGSACVQIKQQFERLDRDAYHSDLPSLGLAYGYFQNFVRPTYQRLHSPLKLMADGEWTEQVGSRLHIVMPDEILNRERVTALFASRGLVKLELDLADGRNISVYRTRRATPAAPLHLYDIPTTLMTSAEVIEKVDHFWGGGDRGFKEQLERREIANFTRSIKELIEDRKRGLPPGATVTSFGEFSAQCPVQG